MKKKAWIVLSVVLAVILLFPVPLRLKDGGTVEYHAILYSVSDVHRLDHLSSTGYIDGLIVRVLGFEVYNNIES